MRIPELEALIERFGSRATLAEVLEVLARETILPPSVLRTEAAPAPGAIHSRADLPAFPARPMPAVEVVRKVNDHTRDADAYHNPPDDPARGAFRECNCPICEKAR